MAKFCDFAFQRSEAGYGSINYPAQQKGKRDALKHVSRQTKNVVVYRNRERKQLFRSCQLKELVIYTFMTQKVSKNL